MDILYTTSATMINTTYFPGKLWRLVNDPQIHSIWWDVSGEGILVHQQFFEAEVLSSQTEYFRTKDFISFIRQLNLYGFRKERMDRDISEKQDSISPIKAQLHRFYNPDFKRDKPELLLKIQRRTPHNKAKLLGIKVTSQKPKHFYHGMLNSTQESCALMKTGSILLGHQGTPYHHPCNYPQQEKWSNTPHQSQHGFYTPVYQRCSPEFLDSTVPCFQQPAASYSPCDYYPDYSVGYTHLIDQDPYLQADVPESMTSDPEKEKEELDAILNLPLDMQDYSVGYTHLFDQDPYLQADVPESMTSDPEKEKEELDAILNLPLDMQDYSVGYTHLFDQDPYLQADVPESRTSDPEKEKEELDAILNLALDMQDEVDARRLQSVTC